MTTVGFVGLGAMGRPMVNCMLKAGYVVTVHDVSVAAVERLVADGAVAASSVREVAAASDLVFTMLPRAEDVVGVVLGPDGILDGIRPGSVLIDTSTIDVGTARSLAAPLAERGAGLLDGGVSGSPGLAWEGGVTFIVGGDETQVERFRPVFEALAATIVYAGPLGTAKAMKLANNMVAAILTAALAEAFTLITASGADPVVAKRAMDGSWAKTVMLDVMPPLPGLGPDSPADHGYEGGFSVGYMAKDLEAVLESAGQAGAVLLTTGFVHQLFTAAVARGDGALSLSALIRTTRAFGRSED